MGVKKRVLGIILLLSVLFFTVKNAYVPQESKEISLQSEFNQSNSIHILTDEELSRLYTCKPDERHIDEEIVELSQADATLLMQIARSEAGPDCTAQLWVMGTIINRLHDGTFGSSITEIVSAPSQFDVYTSGRYKKADVNENSHLALAMIEKGQNPTKGALYFRSADGSDDSWHENNKTFVGEVEGQRYYR